MNALGVKFAEHADPGFKQGGTGRGVAGGEKGGEVFRAGAISADRVEGGGDFVEFVAVRAEARAAFRVGRFVERQAGEKVAGGSFEALQGAQFEAVNRRDTVKELFAGGRGAFLADVSERSGGIDAGRGGLAGEQRLAKRRHAGRADEHDGGKGNEKDKRGDEATALEEFSHRGARGRGGGAACPEAADEEFPLVFDGHEASGWRKKGRA